MAKKINIPPAKTPKEKNTDSAKMTFKSYLEKKEKQYVIDKALTSVKTENRSDVEALAAFHKDKKFVCPKCENTESQGTSASIPNENFCKIERVFQPFDSSSIDRAFSKFVEKKTTELNKISKIFQKGLSGDEQWLEFLADGELCLFSPSKRIMLPHPTRWRNFYSEKKRFSETIEGELLPESFFKDFSQCPKDTENPWTIFAKIYSEYQDLSKTKSKKAAVPLLSAVPYLLSGTFKSCYNGNFHFIVLRGGKNKKSAKWPFTSYAGYSCSDFQGKYVLPCHLHKESSLHSFLKAHLIPNTPEYKPILDLYVQHPSWLKNDDTLNVKAIVADFHAGKTVWGWNRHELVEKAKKGAVSFSDKESQKIEDNLLNCDFIRFDGDVYKKNILTDYHQGHWDLWPEENAADQEITHCKTAVTLEKPFYGRNPLVDIRQNAIVAIDFGTKSTSVAFLDGGCEICPFPIGCTKEQKTASNNPFENPTVLHFIDFSSFIRAYQKRRGRPYTKWSQLTVSHTASNVFEEGTDADCLASIVSELKQWTASGKKLYVADHFNRNKKDGQLSFPPFLDCPDDDIDPIEIYAYYIGCSLNNMYNKIFLNYLMSFSITYDNKTKERIRRSFEKGLRKSLPNTLLNKPDVMKKFSVSYGDSEPGAYAVCALEELNLLPSEHEKKVFYGVFDFGGGTTDFDFGCCSLPEEDDGFDYEIEHFKANGYGDKYLGGENILRSLSYIIFKENREELFQQNISFAASYENSAVLANEGKFVSDSLEAEMNTRLLMAKLRPLWEKPESKEALIFDSGEIRLTLFDDSGEQCSGIKLQVDSDALRNWIRDRISRGVVNFFAAMKSTFHNSNQWKSVKKIHILLAGNSCKAAIVKQVFDEQCAAFSKDNKSFESVFEIHLPLGEECKDKKKLSTREFYRPNGKTGVVWGLLLGRDGGAFLQKNRHNAFSAQYEACFNFFIGRSVRGQFETKLSPSTGNSWTLFRKANTHSIEFYYTTDPGASTGCILADKFVLGTIENLAENAWILIRAKSANSFEFAVAQSISDANKQNFLLAPEELFLK